MQNNLKNLVWIKDNIGNNYLRKGDGGLKDRSNYEIATTRLIRLVYYNNFLLEEGVLTSREHQRMNNAIISKYGNEARKIKDRFPYSKTLFPPKPNEI